MLTDAECMAFRQMPGTFDEMVRAIHTHGRRQGEAEAKVHTANAIIYICDDLISSGYDDEVGMLDYAKAKIKEWMEIA